MTLFTAACNSFQSLTDIVPLDRSLLRATTELYAFAGMPAFPIEIHTAHDPAWEVYEQFKAGVNE